MAQGIDCASYQGAPNWPAVRAAGIEFAYIKASDGISSSYPTTNAQWSGASAAGLQTGLYHFGQPSLSPEANADAFALQVNRLGAVAGHLPPCLDLEIGSGYLGDWAAAFVARLRAKTGCRKVMIYSGAAFFRDQITEKWMDPDVVVWIAHYGAPQGRPGYLTPRVALHQYDSSSPVPGIAGNVDHNVTIWPLASITGGASAAPVTTAPARGENMITPIPVTYLGGGRARAIVPVENAASGSAAIDQCWVGVGVSYGPTGSAPQAGFKAHVVLNSLRADGTLEKTEAHDLGNNQSLPKAYGASPQARQVTVDVTGLPDGAGPTGTTVTVDLVATSR